MTYEEKITKLAELENQIRADDTDWESFFQAAELWEEIMADLWQGKTEEERYQARRRVWNLVEGRREAMRPGLWKRLWNTITRGTKR